MRVYANRHVRNYTMVSRDVVYDAKRWLSALGALVSRGYDELDSDVFRGRMLKAWFVKTNPATGEVLRRLLIYISFLHS